MKDYAAMSDFEINKAVALLCTIEGVVINEDGCPVKNVIDDSPGSYSGGDYIEFDFNPCNNPADAWPIIVDNKIAIANFTDGNSASWSTKWGMVSNFYSEGENPLRCAMVVFLMMKESEND